MTDIIRSQDDVSAATTAQLVATYNAMTGNSIKKFESRAIAEARTTTAIMAAEAAAGKAGVRPGQKIVAMTKQELAEKAQDGAKASSKAAEPEQPSVPAEKTSGEPESPYPEDSMANSLWLAALKCTPPTVREKKVREPREPGKRVSFDSVEPTHAGTSKCQPGSKRAAVLAFVNGIDGPVSVADIETAMGYPVRGYLQKLLEKDHIQIVKEQA